MVSFRSIDGILLVLKYSSTKPTYTGADKEHYHMIPFLFAIEPKALGNREPSGECSVKSFSAAFGPHKGAPCSMMVLLCCMFSVARNSTPSTVQGWLWGLVAC